jgi:hypothetical protein
MLAASASPLDPGIVSAAGPGLSPDLRPIAAASAARLAPTLRGGPIYTDDLAPVEWLVDESIVGYLAGTR